MIDLETVKRQTDLLCLCGADTTLNRVASSGGGEWAGPCPFCGGRDRFRVQPYQWRWLCRKCSDGKWRDAIEYIGRREHLNPRKYSDLREICQRAVGSVFTTFAPRAKTQQPSAIHPPLELWQANAQVLIQRAVDLLWSPDGRRGLDYLRSRGLSDQTINKWHLGYIPSDQFEPVQKWGLHNDGANQSNRMVWIPRGLVIPCFIQGKIWYVKFRRFGSEPKYVNLKGGCPGLFGADQLSQNPMALLCEGEFDTILADQEIGEDIAACTFGSATNHGNLDYWIPYFRNVSIIMAAYDNDDAGQKGVQALQNLGFPIIPVNLPSHPYVKDITDFYVGGGDLASWISHTAENAVRVWAPSFRQAQISRNEFLVAENEVPVYTSHRLNRGVK